MLNLNTIYSISRNNLSPLVHLSIEYNEGIITFTAMYNNFKAEILAEEDEFYDLTLEELENVILYVIKLLSEKLGKKVFMIQ